MSLDQDLELKVDEVLQTESVQQAKQLLRARSGAVLVGAISFIEAALPVPILTDPFLVAAILAHRANAFRLVLVTTVMSVVGGVAAYLMAAFFFDTLQWWLSPALLQQFDALVATNTSDIFVLTLIGAVTPIPYTFAAWAVAVLQGSVLTFIVASLIGRGARYVLVGYLVYRFGEPALQYAKRYLSIVSLVLLLAALGYWFLNM